MYVEERWREQEARKVCVRGGVCMCMHVRVCKLTLEGERD